MTGKGSHGPWLQALPRSSLLRWGLPLVKDILILKDILMLKKAESRSLHVLHYLCPYIRRRKQQPWATGSPDERATPPLSPRTTNDPHPIRSDPIAGSLLISILPLSRLPASFLTFFSFLSPPSLGADREYAWYARFACPGDETKMLSVPGTFMFISYSEDMKV